MSKHNSKREVVLSVVVAVLVLVIISMAYYIGKDNMLLSGKTETNQKGNNQDSNLINNGNNQNESSSNFDLTVDSKKCINSKGETYTLAFYDNADGLSIKLSEDRRSVKLSINWSLFGPLSGSSAWSSDIESLTINNFSTEIKDIYIGGYGQDISGVTILYLMSDGTVEYTPLLEAMTNNKNIKSYGKIPNVSGVVKFYTADAMQFGGVTMLAQRADGTFYDLGLILLEK